jgi:soluble lytic murein transglycosylase
MISFKVIACALSLMNSHGMRSTSQHEEVIWHLASRTDNPDIAIVAFIESRFNRNAISGAGARGVMQVMPRTMRYMEKWGRCEIPDGDRLTSWKYHATIGICYFDSYLGELLSDEIVERRLIAYNAGPSRVRLHPNALPRETLSYVLQYIYYRREVCSSYYQ